MIALNDIIFPNYYQCRYVSVHIVSDVHVGIRAFQIYHNLIQYSLDDGSEPKYM
jgi:hypothetical protein